MKIMLYYLVFCFTTLLLIAPANAKQANETPSTTATGSLSYVKLGRENSVGGADDSISKLAARKRCSGPESTEELRQLLWAGPKSNYEKRTRPGIAKWKAEDYWTRGLHKDIPPDMVRVQLHILSVTNLDQKRGEFQIMAWFREKWNDQRLQYNTIENGGCFSIDERQGFSLEDLEDGIWQPDITFQNQVEKFLNAGSFWIYPNGDVEAVKSIQLTVSCKMDLQDFPKDVQQCKVLVGTWLEDATDIVLDFYGEMDPVTIGSTDQHSTHTGNHTESQQNGNLEYAGVSQHGDHEHGYAEGWGGSSEWYVKDISWKHDDNSSDGIASTVRKKSLVEFKFAFERNSRYYVDFVIMPCLLFVIIGWSSFFISRGAAPARVTMTMICFLTNINFLSAQLNTLPRDSSSIWLLRFLIMSTFFTFYTVVEYVCCNYLYRVEVRVEAAHERARELKKQKYGSMLHMNSFSDHGSCNNRNNSIEEGNDDSVHLGDIEEGSNEGSDHCSFNSHKKERTKNKVSNNKEDATITSSRNKRKVDNSTAIPSKVRRRSTLLRRSRFVKMTSAMANQPSFRIRKPKEIPTSKADLISLGFKNKIDMLLLDPKGQMIFKDQHLDIFSRIAYPIVYILATIALIIIVEV